MRGLSVLSVAAVLLIAGCSSSGGSASPDGRRHPTTTVPVTTTPGPAGSGCKLASTPDPHCTPGALNPSVTPASIASTICKSGWTGTVRPPVSESNRLKGVAAVAYGINPFNPGLYEGDHFIPLELGGAADSITNFWDEPHTLTGPDGLPAGSLVKDGFENYLNSQVCHAVVRMPLAQAQAEIRGNWYAAYTAAGRPRDPYYHGKAGAIDNSVSGN